jgi:hypothetical protein
VITIWRENGDQLRELKELQEENERLCKGGAT